MLRFVIRRKMLDRRSGLASDGLETVDADCPELERVLLGGGTGMDSYDYRELAGAEVLPKTQGLPHERIAEIWVEHGCDGEDAEGFARAIERAHGIGA